LVTGTKKRKEEEEEEEVKKLENKKITMTVSTLSNVRWSPRYAKSAKHFKKKSRVLLV